MALFEPEALGSEQIDPQNNTDFSGSTIGDWQPGNGTVVYNTDIIGGSDNKQGLMTKGASGTHGFAYLSESVSEAGIYLISANVYMPSSNVSYSLTVRAQNFRQAGENDNQIQYTLVAEQWTNVRCYFVAFDEGGGLSGTIQLRLDDASENDKFYFDDISLKKVTPLSVGKKVMGLGLTI